MSSREIMDSKNGYDDRKSYGFRDPVVKRVVDKFVDRSNTGFVKYGRTLHSPTTYIIKYITFRFFFI